MSKPNTDYASELHDAVKQFIDQPLNNPLTRSQIMDIARIALPTLEKQERDELVRVAFTGSGSLEAIKRGGEGFIWGNRAEAHPIELFIHSKDAACEKCNGTGEMDSGGTQPWGEQILVECDCRIERRERGERDWIEWSGDGIPVDDNVLVEVKWRNGAVLEDIADAFAWYHDGFDNDIIAYRLVKS